jgi:hypothetical protein
MVINSEKRIFKHVVGLFLNGESVHWKDRVKNKVRSQTSKLQAGFEPAIAACVPSYYHSSFTPSWLHNPELYQTWFSKGAGADKVSAL